MSFGSRHRFQVHFGAIAANRGEIAALIQNVGDAAGHSGGEVASRSAEHDHQAVGHVFAAVVANAFDHGRRARIAHRKPLARHAAEESFAARRAVEAHVADEDIFLGHELRISRRGR